jgi:3-oxoadipate enol-lactonase
MNQNVTQTTEIRDAEISRTAEGDGPVVVWAHGLSSSRRAQEDAGMFDWSPVAASGKRLIRYDARGHGQSRSALGAERFTWQELARDLIALAEIWSPAAPVDVIGTSMGTATALWAATERPDLFHRLVLTGPPTQGETRSAMAHLYEQGADMVEHDGADGYAAMVAAAPAPTPFADLPGYPPPLGVDPAVLPDVLRGAARSDLPGTAAIKAITQPTLVLSWSGDAGHPVSSGELLTSLIDGSQFEIADHSAQTRAWGAKAAEFLR